MGENDKLSRHYSDLARTALFQGRYTSTGFLSPEEQNLVKMTMAEDKYLSWRLLGGNESHIRKIAVFGDPHEIGYEFQPPICVIAIEPLSEKFGESLSHRDYLGAIMSLGIERSTTGDIVIKDKRAWLFCLESISEYIITNLTSVRHTSVRCTIADESVPEIRPRLKEIQINVASERLDAVIAGMLNLSRTKALSLIKDERVFVNGSTRSNAGCLLKKDDEIVVRGFGKFIYDGGISITRKGRLYVGVRQYI